MNTFDEDHIQHLLGKIHRWGTILVGIGLVAVLFFVGEALVKELPQLNLVGALTIFALIGVALWRVHSRSSHS